MGFLKQKGQIRAKSANLADGKKSLSARPIDSYSYHMTQLLSQFSDRIIKVSVIISGFEEYTQRHNYTDCAESTGIPFLIFLKNSEF